MTSISRTIRSRWVSAGLGRLVQHKLENEMACRQSEVVGERRRSSTGTFWFFEEQCNASLRVPG